VTVFVDSSALVKRYVPERGHDAIHGLVALAVSQLVRVEVPAALWRKHRIGELDAADAAMLVRAFEADYHDGAPFAVVAVRATVLDDAVRHTARHGLRAYDAVQLASAVACRAASPDTTSFAAFDRTLRDAAAREGFDLVPTSVS
jgi:predicted nucleic acid-binding protein